ncbi:MAG: hypothetical protein ACRC5C_03425 [Bacilli bacterium]
MFQVLHIIQSFWFICVADLAMYLVRVRRKFGLFRTSYADVRSDLSVILRWYAFGIHHLTLVEVAHEYRARHFLNAVTQRINDPRQSFKRVLAQVLHHELAELTFLSNYQLAHLMRLAEQLHTLDDEAHAAMKHIVSMKLDYERAHSAGEQSESILILEQTIHHARACVTHKYTRIQKARELDFRFADLLERFETQTALGTPGRSND